MIRLDLAGYYSLPMPARRRVDAWLDAEGLDRVVAVELLDESGRRARVESLDVDAIGPGSEEVPVVAAVVEARAPFPVEVLAELRSPA